MCGTSYHGHFGSVSPEHLQQAAAAREPSLLGHRAAEPACLASPPALRASGCAVHVPMHTHTHPFSPFTSFPRVQMYPWVTEGSAPDDLTAIEPNMKHQKAASCESWGPSQLKPNWSDTHIWGFIHFHSGFQAIVVLRCRSLTDIQTLKRYVKIYIVMWKVWVNNMQITELS